MTADVTRPTRRLASLGLAATVLPVASRRASAQGANPKLADPKAQDPKAAEPPERVLRAAPARARLAPDAAEEAELWRFDGDGLPVLRLRHGDELRVRLVNETPAPLSLHWHGVRNQNAFDGAGGLTQPPVAPGASFTYRFRPPDPGTSLVRPLVLGRSGEPAGRGLAGLLVVEEREPVPVDAEYALVVRDWRLEPSGALAPFGDPREAALAGRLGHRLAVDGGDAPKRIEAAPGSRIRIRLANACNARILRLRFDDLRVFVTGVDGQPADKFEPLRSSLPFPPGSRYDIVLDLPRSPGAKGAITALVGDGLPLVALGTTDAPARPERPPIAAPAPNPLLPAEIKLQAALRRDVLILGGASRGPDGQLTFPGPGKPIWSVNGEPGSAAAPPLLQAKRGQPVVLGITNRTGFPQPLHLHGHVARLLHPLDDGWEPYWMDTFQVPEGKTVHIAFVADNPGRWLLGSTVLERLDAGLWTSFEVT